MSELDNEENIKNTIQDTQMLIRNHMQQHKKISKQLHGQIKKDKKTIDGIDAETDAAIASALDYALSCPLPSAERLEKLVYAEGSEQT